MEENKDLTPAEVLGRLKSNRLIVGIPLVVLVADVFVRWMSSFDLSVIRPVESVIFSIAGLSFLSAARSDRQLSLKTYRIEMWFALAFILGALRDGLWAAGMNIQNVNIVDLAIGVVGGVCVYFWTHRPSLQVPATRISPTRPSNTSRETSPHRPSEQ
jgi:hypothetical protein